MARLPGERNNVPGELVVRCVKKVADKTDCQVPPCACGQWRWSSVRRRFWQPVPDSESRGTLLPARRFNAGKCKPGRLAYSKQGVSPYLLSYGHAPNKPRGLAYVDKASRLISSVLFRAIF
jgi:hypothetical protein